MSLEEIITQVERVLRVGLAIIAAYVVALWVAAVWWTLRDIRSRTNDVFLQLSAVLLVVLFNFPGLVLYLILRPSRTLAELYEAALHEEALLQGMRVPSSCPVCKQQVEADFIFCPWCRTRLKEACPRCQRPLLLRWQLCPYCGEGPVEGRLLPEEETTRHHLPEAT
ncbi:MAG TPA: zinc ribbon domain-containing protein [Chloroflexota bacterium]